MDLIIEAPLPGRPGAHHNYVHGNDEAWVSTVLHYKNIFLTHDSRYFVYCGDREAFIKAYPKRSLRFNRGSVPKRTEPSDTFAWVVYLNWTGWHNTGPEIILREFTAIWERVK